MHFFFNSFCSFFLFKRSRNNYWNRWGCKRVEVTVTETVTVELDPFADSTLEGVLTSDKTLSSDKIWLIKGRVVVGEALP